MDIKEVLQHFGSGSEVAERLGVTPQAVSTWVQRGKVPPLRQLQIEELTGGKLRADRSSVYVYPTSRPGQVA